MGKLLLFSLFYKSKRQRQVEIFKEGWLHNLQGLVQNKNAGPFVKKIVKNFKTEMAGLSEEVWRARRGRLSRAVKVILPAEVKYEKVSKLARGFAEWHPREVFPAEGTERAKALRWEW